MTIKLVLTTLIFLVLTNNNLLANTEFNYQEPEFNQYFIFNPADGVSFQKIVEVHREYNENQIVLTDSMPFVYGSDYEQDMTDDTGDVSFSTQSASQSTRQSSASNSFASMSTTAQQSTGDDDQSDLYFYMNALQYDEGNGVREELMYSMK